MNRNKTVTAVMIILLGLIMLTLALANVGSVEGTYSDEEKSENDRIENMEVEDNAGVTVKRADEKEDENNE